MNVSLIADRYAKALFDLAWEKKCIEKVYDDIRFIAQAIKETRTLKLFFRAPLINPGKKKAVMRNVFGSTCDPLTLSFLDFLISKRRDDLIPEIAQQFISQYKENKNILTVYLRTPLKVDELIRKSVVSIMQHHTGSTIELVEEADPSLIGGFVISWKDYQYDASIRRQLERLQRGVARVNLFVKGF
jgi:F-type H+-transporting ATPase subunit delta